MLVFIDRGGDDIESVSGREVKAVFDPLLVGKHFRLFLVFIEGECNEKINLHFDRSYAGFRRFM